MAKTRLQEKYLSEAVKGMMDKFNYKNVMEIPKIEKVVINMGIGEAVANSKALDSAVADLTLIAGQRPVITKAKKSIAAFKLRQGMPIGTKVTLRGDRMYYFLDKLMNIALPRVRDFRGVNPTAFVGRGFKSCLKYHVSLADGSYPAAMLVKELVPGALDGHKWHYYDSPIMQIDEACAQRYDDSLEKLEKKYQPSQEAFYIHSHAFLKED